MVKMSRADAVCLKCGAVSEGKSNFCPLCGFALSRTDNSEGLVKGLKTKVSLGAMGVVSTEKASDAVRRMLNLVIQVAREVRKDLPDDMIKAVDISAEISFIAFSIGISVDLEQIKIQEKSEN
jgi:RNA polymerase subunit RPABC4/transcription elongation factor Spt4